MDEEIQAFLKNHNWDVMPLSHGKRAISCKWVHTKKHHADGTLECLKSRIVAWGFTQSYGIDYFKTFSPVVKMDLVYPLLALVTQYQWLVWQFDVKNAFLHGDLTEEVYMQHPPGYPLCPPKMACHQWKSLYVLKLSPQIWFGRFTCVMRAQGYTQSNGDVTLLLHHGSTWAAILVVYVDEILITGSDGTEAAHLSTVMKGFHAIIEYTRSHVKTSSKLTNIKL